MDCAIATKRNDISKEIDQMVDKLGKDNVVGYICCSIYTFIMSAKECNEKEHFDLRNFYCDLIVDYIAEYERLTGESAPIDDVIEDLDWWPSRENQPL